MTTSVSERSAVRASGVAVSDDELTVDLSDGRTLSVPLAWFPRLVHATRAERTKWRLVGQGVGVHWTALDEDVSVEGLLAGRPSGESQASLARWLSSRPKPRRRRGHSSSPA